MITTDEREGCTSASSAEADSLCAGRHLAQRGIPEGVKSADATTGTRIHAALEGSIPVSSLEVDEIETAEKCQIIEATLEDSIFGVVKPNVIREQRLWATVGTGKYRHSGKADVIYTAGSVALVLDYKTGRNEATESARNLQLRDLAVLVASNFGFRTVHVAIIQPWATMNPEVCTYEVDDLITAQDSMADRVVLSNDKFAKRTPGNVQCQYCRAKATCAEFLAASLPTIPPSEPDNVSAGVRALTSERLGKFLALVRMAEETATEEVRRRLDAGESVDGWTIKPGRETEKITNAQTVFNRALAAGITQGAFVAECITVGKTALKTALKTATGAKGKALDAKMDELLAGATETKTSSPILTKV